MASRKTPTTPAQKAAVTRANNKAASSRDAFHAQNPGRNQDLASAMAEGWRSDKDLREKIRGAGFDPDAEIDRQEKATRKMGVGSAYRARGWTGEPSDTASNHPGQGTLFKDDRLMDTPTRWEDMDPKDHARILAHAAAHGVTMDSAKKAYGSQLDRAMLREDGKHQSFYSEEGTNEEGVLSPRSRLKQSAAANGVPFHIQAVANAITSPNARFAGRSASGEPVYPNDVSASHAINWGKSGKTGEEYLHHPDYYIPPEEYVKRASGRKAKAAGETRAYPVQGYPKNSATAIDVTTAVRGGTPVRDAWKPSDADKVKPYYNSWVDPHAPESQFHVSDIHSGISGMVPHLSKRGGEAYMSAKGIHAFNDHVARMVMNERGLSSVSRTQSSQWSQAKLEKDNSQDLDTAPVARNSHLVNHQQMTGQQGLF